jgi:Ulp1 family protease
MGRRSMEVRPRNEDCLRTVFVQEAVRSNGQLFLSFFLVLLLGENLTESVTVSTKIPKQLKEKMQGFKIKPSKILRKALEDEVKKREIAELKEEIEKLKPTLEKVSMENIVKSIREDRDSR